MYYRFLTGSSIFIALLRGESFLQNDHISHFAVPSYLHAKTLLSAGSSSGLATTFHAYVFPPQGQHILKCHTFPYLLGPQETGLFETGLFLSSAFSLFFTFHSCCSLCIPMLPCCSCGVSKCEQTYPSTTERDLGTHRKLNSQRTDFSHPWKA